MCIFKSRNKRNAGICFFVLYLENVFLGILNCTCYIEYTMYTVYNVGIQYTYVNTAHIQILTKYKKLVSIYTLADIL